jgi:hypothetical protein
VGLGKEVRSLGLGYQAERCTLLGLPCGTQSDRPFLEAQMGPEGTRHIT